MFFLYMETTVNLSRPQFIGRTKRVATSWDSESQDPSSNLSRTFFFFFPSLVFSCYVLSCKSSFTTENPVFWVQYKYKAMHIWDTIGSGSSLIGVWGQNYAELTHMTEVANQNMPLVACTCIIQCLSSIIRSVCSSCSLVRLPVQHLLTAIHQCLTLQHTSLLLP